MKLASLDLAVVLSGPWFVLVRLGSSWLALAILGGAQLGHTLTRRTGQWKATQAAGREQGPTIEEGVDKGPAKYSLLALKDEERILRKYSVPVARYCPPAGWYLIGEQLDGGNPLIVRRIRPRVGLRATCSQGRAGQRGHAGQPPANAAIRFPRGSFWNGEAC